MIFVNFAKRLKESSANIGGFKEENVNIVGTKDHEIK